MRVVPVPCLRDNYAYILVCEDSGEAAVVDPSEPGPVIQALQRLNLPLTAIFNTHHHYDHVGGNNELAARYPGVRIFAHESDRGRVPGQTDFLKEGDRPGFGRVQGSLTHNPGHTTGAVTYYFGQDAFTGDTLFAAGCGRLFEGSPGDMHASLNEKIGGHAPETRLWFGHEYTVNNLRFAQMVEPDNPHIEERLAKSESLRSAGQFTTPSTLAKEWLTNPFMRCDSDTVKASAKKHDPTCDLSPHSVLKAIREMKDAF